MPQETNAQEIIQVLRDRLGMRWDGEREDGRDEMIRVVEDSLKLDHAQARDAVDSLIDSGEVTYNVSQDSSTTGATDEAMLAPDAGMIATPVTGSSSLVGISQNLLQAGYWRFGRGTSDSSDTVPIVGRAGQIDPTA